MLHISDVQQKCELRASLSTSMSSGFGDGGWSVGTRKYKSVGIIFQGCNIHSKNFSHNY